jgi:hypothetical protein
MAAVGLLMPEAQKLILNHPLMIYTPHDLGGVLNSKEKLWLSDSCLLKHQAQLLGGTEITLRTCQSLNPVSLLPEAEGNPEHSCEEVLMENYAAQPDLTDRPLKGPDLEVYTDGSSFVKNGVRHARFAVVTEFGILKSGLLPPNTSAQLAELVTLMEALRLSKEQRVNIYTASKYVFLILHAHAAIWKKRGMLTTIGAASHKDKREVTLIVLGITALVTALARISYGVIANLVTAKNLTKVVEDTSDQVGLAVKDMQRSLLSLACFVMDHHRALDILLVKQGGVCAITNTSCCTYINTSGIVEEHADYILQQAKWLQEQSLKTQVSTQLWEQIKSWLPSRTWFLPFLGPIVAIILLLVFGPCILNLLVKFVSSHLESIKLQMPLVELKTTVVPLTTPLMVSPEAAGPSIAPCQQEAVTEQTSSSLSLAAVRAIPETDGGLEGQTTGGRSVLASERHLHPQAMQK